ncbi:MAG: aminotransferase class V-fold PLP-dependent enzyme [Candidatus Hodarchaeota archaeon]
MNYLVQNENSATNTNDAFEELERALFTALKTYSNVHRGTGHNSLATTALYEQARVIILDYLQLNNKKYTVVFCSPLRLEIFKTQLNSTDYFILSSRDFELPLGVRAIAVKKRVLRKCSVIFTGGGMIKHVTSKYVIWADPPERFEAGTPNILNIIAFAVILQLIKNPDKVFKIRIPNWEETSHEILYHDELDKFSGIELLHELQKLLVGHNIKVPTLEGIKHFINLDNAASTPTFSPIWKVFCKTLRQSKEIHKDIIHDVKEIISKFLNAPLDKYDIIFSLNTTEAINIVARNLAIKPKKNKKSVIINTELEHHSNELPFRYIPNTNLMRISVDDDGFINSNELEDLLRKYNQNAKLKTRKVELVSVSAASNVLGTRNDLKAISEIVHKYGAKMLIDAAQLVAHHKINISDIDIDYFTFSGHKIYAPFGTGVLVVKKRLIRYNPNEIMKIKLSGEENVVGIATLGKAILLLEKIGIEKIEDYENNLIEIAIDGLRKIEDVKIFGIDVLNSYNISKRGSIISFNLAKVPHNVAAKELAEYGGIGVRNGCFCAHILIQKILKIQKIRILGARMTSLIFPKRTAMCLPGTLRISIGIENKKSDVDYLIKTIKTMVHKPRSIMDKLFGYTNNGTLFVPRTKTEEKIKHFVNKIVKKVYVIPNV